MPTAEEIRANAAILDNPVPPTATFSSPDAPLPPPPVEQPLRSQPEPELEQASATPQEAAQQYAPFFHGQMELGDLQRQGEEIAARAGAIALGTDLTAHAKSYQEMQLAPWMTYEKNLRDFAEAREAELQEYLEATKPSMLASVSAMLEEENILSAMVVDTPIPFTAPDPNYSPMQDPVTDGFEAYASLWYLSTSAKETQAIVSNIQRQINNREIIARSSTSLNIASGMLAGLGSPINLVAIAGMPVLASRTAMGALSGGRALAAGAATGLVTTAIDEVLLLNENELRTLDESKVNIAASFLLDTTLGTAALGYAKGVGAYKQAQRDVLEYMARGGRPKDTEPLLPDGSVGAAKVDQGLEIDTTGITWADPVRKVAFETAKVMSRATPLGRLLQADSGKARALANDLLEHQISLTGDAGNLSVESLVNKEINKTALVLLDVDKLAKEARKKYGWSNDQFYEVLDAARRRGDTSDYDEVAKAARIIRVRTDELWNRAAQARVPGTFKTITKKDPKTGEMVEETVPITQQTAESYARRGYDRNEVIDKKPEFYEALAAGLEANRKLVNADVDAKLGAYQRENAKELKQRQGYIANAPQEKKNLRSLLKNKDTAIKANSREIGRRKALDKDDPEIAKLEAKIREIEKSRAKIEQSIKDIDAEVKASKKFVSTFNARIKELEGQRIDELDPDDVSRYQDEFYEGVTGLRLGDMPYTAQPTPSMFKSRQPILDEYLEDFLVKNARDELTSMTNQLAPRIHLQERFGEIELTTYLQGVNDEYSSKILAAEQTGNTKYGKALRREQERVLKDLKRMRDRLLMRVNDPTEHPTAASLGRSLLYFNISTKLAGQLISSIPEVGKIIARYGFVKTLQSSADGLKQIIPSMKKNRDSMQKLGAAASESMLVRPAQTFDAYDATPTTRLEKGTQTLANLTTKVSLQQLFDSTFRGMAATLWADGIANAIKKGDTAALSKAGFTNAEIKVMQREIKRATPDGGLLRPNFDEWKYGSATPGYDPRMLKDKIEALAVKETNMVIVKPGIGDRPVFMDKMVAKIIFQFKSFIIAATNRTMLPMSQNGSSFWKHTLVQGSLGLMSYMAYQAAKGEEVDLSPESLAWEAFSRGGFMGYATDMAAITSRVSGLGEGPSRYQSRNALGTIAGPSLGTLGDAFGLPASIVGAVTEDANAVDRLGRTVRRLTPFQNHFLLRQPLDILEGEAVRALGGTGRYADRN